jgi:hypothetical protein
LLAGAKLEGEIMLEIANVASNPLLKNEAELRKLTNGLKPNLPGAVHQVYLVDRLETTGKPLIVWTR